MSSDNNKVNTLNIYKFGGGAFFQKEECLIVAETLEEAEKLLAKEECLSSVMTLKEIVVLKKGLLMTSTWEVW